MRLSEVLNRAPDSSQAQVEGFLGSQRLGWGRHKNIEIGRVIRNYFCRPCDDTRTFFSSDRLSCLVTGSHSVSIDVTLRCSACQSPMEAWFLVGCADDLFGQAPLVHLERFTENKRDVATAVGAQVGEIHELFERAQIAFEDHLGAGSMVYLRKAFEIVTSQAAVATGNPPKHSSGRRKTFKSLLEEVDEQSHIIPLEFSNNGYKLFSELSEVIHGDSDEAEALTKYEPCRQLVLGIVTNVRNNQSMAAAIDSLGWNGAAPLQVVEGGGAA